MARTSYAIALGSNRPHGRYGRPAGVLAAAVGAIGELGTVTRLSPVLDTKAWGPAGRCFANGALILETEMSPRDLLAALKALERRFGRRRGRRWGPRVLDLDIILWSRGRFHDRRLQVPHPQMAARPFVLLPLARIAPDWRVPPTGLAVRHLAARLYRG